MCRRCTPMDQRRVAALYGEPTVRRRRARFAAICGALSLRALRSNGGLTALRLVTKDHSTRGQRSRLD